ncbi:pyridoxal-phosphate-dependent aminotransferase family protein [Aquimarina sp. W85]|uniref:pyridoxal-phosphate-dependent aminotransferase family protein n=1 Tax=Aquimarina rhodophyticola TaxID=3342246 RepID=UPI0036717AE0
MIKLKTTNRILMGPGPSDVHPKVLQAMATPLIGHLDPEFVVLMDEVKQMVQQTFMTQNELSFVVSAPGTAGMETCLVNLLEPGDEAIICVNGVFGERMVAITERCGAIVHTIESPWGSIITEEQVATILKVCKKPKVLAIVHAETSTGVLQPLERISELVHDAGALLVVDAVTSYCGMPLKVDEWKIDAVYTGTQKCLSAPPGLSPISLSKAAVKVIEARKTPVQSWFMDLNLVKNYWSGSKRAYHHTAPVSSIFALHQALCIVLEEGLENRYLRHQKVHAYLVEKLEALGFKFLVDHKYRLPNLNAVYLPKGNDEALLRTKLLKNYNIEVGGGLGNFAGKIWRIGIMGESCTIQHVDKLINALKDIKEFRHDG